MVRWYAYKLQDNPEPYCKTKRDRELWQADGTFDVLPKKEVIELKKEWEKLQKNLGGIKEMKRLPDAIFIVDPKKERICVQEAHTLGIPLIGICDTNCDPEELDYVIPGNDDAIRAVKLNRFQNGRRCYRSKPGTADAEAEKFKLNLKSRSYRRIIIFEQYSKADRLSCH